MKNQLKIFLIIMFAAGIMLTGCKKDDTDTPAPLEPKGFSNIPKVGHMWIIANDSAGVDLGNDTIKVIKSLGSGRWLLDQENTMYCTENEFGYTVDDTLNVLLCKADSKINDSYVTNLMPELALTSKIKEINQSVTVPAGTFNCFRVECALNGLTIGTYFINKKYGVIKSEISDLTSRLIYKNF